MLAVSLCVSRELLFKEESCNELCQIQIVDFVYDIMLVNICGQIICDSTAKIGSLSIVLQ